jgi:DNA-binding CsgD family transcriptional regulator
MSLSSDFARLGGIALGDCGPAPWPKLREYLLRVGSYPTRREFMHAASVELQRLIPYDVTAGVFDGSDGRNLEGIGKSEAVTAAYNDYYRTIRPPVSTWIVDWRSFGGLEYTTDFLLPNGMYKCLKYIVPGHPIYLCINRSRFSPCFTDSDITTLAEVDGYINSLYATLETRRSLPDAALSEERIADRFHSLSRREVEVCSLVARRLTTAEIAACLFISGRTVEKHVESIFDKLAVRSRGQLRARLGAGAPVKNTS